jgi:membrane-associated phospholipid phosphatase
LNASSLYSFRNRRFLIYCSAAIVALGAALGTCAFYFDPEISRTIRAYELPGDIEKGVLLSEAFAHGTGVFAILLALFLTGVPRHQVLQIAVITVGAGAIANGLKSCFTRLRPHAFDAADKGGEIIGAFSEMGSGSFWNAAERSFPSGHSATAVAFALGLAYVFPKARWLFLVLALLACYQRIYVGAHFASDVLWGAAIAGTWTLCCIQMKFFRKWESLEEVATKIPLSKTTDVPHA